MYNRYLRNDQGVYTCVPQEEPCRPPPPHRESPPREPPRDTPPPPPSSASFQFLDKLLEKLHLQDLDGADLMLLPPLEEKADDELLIALGLLAADDRRSPRLEEKADDELLIALGLLLIL